MKFYKVLFLDDSLYCYILEVEVLKKDIEEKDIYKRYYLLDIEDGIVNRFARIGSIGTFTEYVNGHDLKITTKVSDEEIGKILEVLNGDIDVFSNRKYIYNKHVESDNEKTVRLVSYLKKMRVTENMEKYFEDNKVVKEYKLLPNDVELLKKKKKNYNESN